MKSIYKSIKVYSSVLLLAGTLVACSEDKMDDINRDKDHTQDAPAKFMLTDVITSTAFNNIGSELTSYMSTYVEHEVGIYNQLWNAQTRAAEVSSATTFNNTWSSIYSNLKNARIIIDKCSEGGSQSGNYATKGMGEIMAAVNTALLTDAFGDAPYSEAALPLVNGKPQFMNPKMDKQEAIYNEIFKYLNDAISDLPQKDNHVSGGPSTQDLLYRGDTVKWRKLAYGLKARYTMHLINKSQNKGTDLENILKYIDKSFTGIEDEAAFAIYDATNVNPSYDFFDSREYLAASKSMCEKLLERKDLRLNRVFVSKINSSGEGDLLKVEGTTNMAPNDNPSQEQRFYNTSIFGFSQTAPTMIMSYHELLFLKAEALQRLERTAEAKDALKEAVIAGFANMERSVTAAFNNTTYKVTDNGTEAVDAEAAGDYFDNKIADLFDASPLKEIMIQKYIALWGASGESVETYNDVRRLKGENESYYEYYGFQNQGKFPLRCPYGADDTTANPNVADAYGNGQYVYTEPVWWAGGSR